MASAHDRCGGGRPVVFSAAPRRIGAQWWMRTASNWRVTRVSGIAPTAYPLAGLSSTFSRSGRSRPLADDLSLTVAAVDTRANIEALLSEALRLAGPRLVTLGRVRLLTGEIGLVSLG